MLVLASIMKFCPNPPMNLFYKAFKFKFVLWNNNKKKKKKQTNKQKTKQNKTKQKQKTNDQIYFKMSIYVTSDWKKENAPEFPFRLNNQRVIAGNCK